MSSEIPSSLKATSAEPVRQIRIHDHELHSRVIISPPVLGFPSAVHEVTIVKGDSARTIRANGFIPKKRST